LASKATGYPLAFVAAKLGLGISLPEIQNAVTKKTQACFEPSLDYIVTKIPRWDLSKFEGVSQEIGSAMKSVGEVMAIGRTVEESFQKALRMVDPAIPGFQPGPKNLSMDQIRQELANPTDKRVFAIAQTLHEGTMDIDEIHNISKIDYWFLYKLEKIVNTWKKLEGVGGGLGSVSRDLMLEAKQMGYSDIQIAQAVPGENSEDAVRESRLAFDIKPLPSRSTPSLLSTPPRRTTCT